MKTDLQIQKDVMDELQWEPFLTSSEIGVAVKNGVVTLSGIVESYARKLAAEKAAKRVAGVKAVAEDIQVGNSPSYRRTDAEIAEAVINALKWHTAIQEDKIKIKVEDGVVRLDGEVEWEYQRAAAKSAVENLTGVKFVINSITLNPKIKASDIEHKINAAFHRSATLDAGHITAEVNGNIITLHGKVRSLLEKDEAIHAAWSAPGVVSVHNDLILEESEYVY